MLQTIADILVHAEYVYDPSATNALDFHPLVVAHDVQDFNGNILLGTRLTFESGAFVAVGSITENPQAPLHNIVLPGDFLELYGIEHFVYVLSISRDGAIYVWDAENEQILQLPPRTSFRKHSNDVLVNDHAASALDVDFEYRHSCSSDCCSPEDTYRYKRQYDLCTGFHGKFILSEVLKTVTPRTLDKTRNDNAYRRNAYGT